MIIVDDTDWLTIITQPDHARFAGELLSLWRLDDLPSHPHRQEILQATREHDNGWQEADSAPWIDPDRHRPYDFLSYPESARLEIWRRGILRFAADQPLVALLIAEHAESIHQPLSDLWLAFFEELESQRQEWLEAAAVDRASVAQDYSFLELADALSLAICTHGAWPATHPALEIQLMGDYLGLDPLPLAGTTTFQIPYRRIDNRAFETDTRVGSALARARWESWQVKVGPLLPSHA